MEKISVIVPVYNTEKYLSRCIGSLVNQSFENKEIILVDDASTDESGVLCDEYARRYNYIKVLHVENGGPNKACYHGLNISEGDYICLCDSDDWLDGDMLYEMSKCLETGKKQIVCCNFVIEKGGGVKKSGHHGARPGIYEGARLKKEIVGELLGHENRTVSMSRCMKLFSRELLTDNTQYWDYSLRMGDDMTIVIPAILDSDRIVIMEGAEYYHYLFVPSSIVHKYNGGLYENIKYLKKTLEKILRQKGAYMEASCEKEYLYLLMLVLKNEARGYRGNYGGRILELCNEESTRSKLKQYPLETAGRAEKLCHFVMKHPNIWTAKAFGLLLRACDFVKGRIGIHGPAGRQ